MNFHRLSKWSFLVVALALCSQIYAQEKFELVEIYTLEGDTLIGSLLKTSEEKNSKLITFTRKVNLEDPEVYEAPELLGYRLMNGSTYDSKLVESIALSTKDQYAGQPDRVARFVELLYTGPTSLYRLHNAKRGALLLGKPNSDQADALYQVAVYKEFHEPQSSKWPRDTIFEKNILLAVADPEFFIEPYYLERLRSFTEDCGDIEVEDDFPFNRTAIKKLLRKYDKCINNK